MSGISPVQGVRNQLGRTIDLGREGVDEAAGELSVKIVSLFRARALCGDRKSLALQRFLAEFRRSADALFAELDDLKAEPADEVRFRIAVQLPPEDRQRFATPTAARRSHGAPDCGSHPYL